MSQSEQDQVTDAATADSAWKGVYRIGGVAALIATVMRFPRHWQMVFKVIDISSDLPATENKR